MKMYMPLYLWFNDPMRFTYRSSDFSPDWGSNFQGENVQEFSLAELIWAAITVGREKWDDVIRFGYYSEFEIIYRASLLFANLWVDCSTGHLRKSPAYESLDPSEKGAVSYFLGMTFTKLLAEKKLETPWLLHIDCYRNHLKRKGKPLSFQSGQSRPDLIGLNCKDEWLVFESKGRTGKSNGKTLEEAKEQTKNLDKIGAQKPVLKVGVVTHYSKKVLTVDWADPEGVNESKSFSIDTSKEEFLKKYYRNIISLLENRKNEERGNIITCKLESINLTVGLDRRIYDAYYQNQLEKLDLRNLEGIQKDNNYYLGSDGILVSMDSELVRFYK